MGAAAADQHQASICVVKLGEPVLVPPAKPCKQETPYFLTNLDQNLAVVMQTVYFFKGLKHLQHKQHGDDDDDAAPDHNSHNSESSPDPAQVIRKALAEVLVHYYPLAGRLSLSKEMKLEVVCEDQGALFVEADAGMSIEEFTDDFKREMGPVSANLMQFIYSVPGARSILDIPLVVAQVTRFRCGGFVLGLCTNHALFDGISAMEFVNSWGEIARGVPLSVSPVLERSMLKARNPLQVQYPHPEFLDVNDPSSPAADDNSRLEFKSMGFSAEWLDSLKQSIVREGVHTKVSSFEAFSALVWKCRTIATSSSSSSSNNQQQTKLLFAVDVRNRLEPPLPAGYFGNGILLTGALTSVQDLIQGSISNIIEFIRQAIHRTDDSYLRSLIDFYEQTRLRPSLSSTLVITTWSRLAFHTTDFGWGTPLYTAPASLPEPEVALLLPHGTARTGFEIVLGLPPAAMGRFVELMQASWRSD